MPKQASTLLERFQRLFRLGRSPLKGINFGGNSPRFGDEIARIGFAELFSQLQLVIHRANGTCLKWSAGKLDLSCTGSEFITQYEVTKYFSELAGGCAGQQLEFDRAAIEAQYPSKDLVGSKVSRNTKRLFLVVRGAQQDKVTLIRAQRFVAPSYFAAEAKGAARAVLQYGNVRSVILIGVGGWPPEINAHDILSAYENIKLAFSTQDLSGLFLELPSEPLQFQDAKMPPLMVTRISRAG